MCLGNICRSPAAESIFIHLIKSQNLEDSYYVDSAGTGGWHVGSQADLRMQEAAKNRGIIIKSIARQITLEDLDRFHLILTMDNENLSELMSLAQGLDPNIVKKIRPILSYSTTSKLIEVPDPYYGGAKGFENVLDLLEDACNELLKELIAVG